MIDLVANVGAVTNLIKANFISGSLLCKSGGLHVYLDFIFKVRS